jgi:rhodanese-related sulfurtransferase
MIARLMGLETVSPEELQRLVREGGVTTFDVNSRERWERAHVPGARHLDPAAFQASDLPADRAAPLVFYCSNPWCRKAPGAARRARQLGWQRVRVLAAGIEGWERAGLATEATPPR